MRKCLFLSRAAICLLVFYQTFLQFKVFENSMFFLAMGVACIAFTALICLFGGGRIRLTPCMLLAFLYMIYMAAVPTFFTGDSEISTEQLIQCVEFTVIQFCVMLTVMADGDMEWFMTARVCMSIVTCISFILSPAVYKDKVMTIQYTLTSSLNPNTFGLNLVFGLWCALWLMGRGKHWPLSLTCALLSSYAILQSASRKSFFCMLAYWGIWCLFIFVRSGKASRRIWRWGLVAAACVALVIWLVPQMADSELATRLSSMSGSKDGSINSRLSMYSRGLTLFQQSPLFGSGFGAYEIAYNDFSHSTVVEVPSCGGIVGSLLYFSMFPLGAWRSFKTVLATRKKPEYREVYTNAVMLLALWGALTFLCTCIVHVYEFDSYIMLSIAMAGEYVSQNGITEADRKAGASKADPNRKGLPACPRYIRQ